MADETGRRTTGIGTLFIRKRRANPGYIRPTSRPDYDLGRRERFEDTAGVVTAPRFEINSKVVEGRKFGHA